MRLKSLLLVIMLLLAFGMQELHSQTFTLRGKVGDENNNPLELATVAVVKQGRVTFTNLKGEFSMELASTDSVVVRFTMVYWICFLYHSLRGEGA